MTIRLLGSYILTFLSPKSAVFGVTTRVVGPKTSSIGDSCRHRTDATLPIEHRAAGRAVTSRCQASTKRRSAVSSHIAQNKVPMVRSSASSRAVA